MFEKKNWIGGSKKWNFLVVLCSINNRKDLRLYGANDSNYCVSFILCLPCSLKCRSLSRENPYQNHQTKNVTKRWQKSTLIFEIYYFIFWNFFHRAVASPVFNVGNWICWTFRNRWLNVADGVAEYNYCIDMGFCSYGFS